MNREQLGELLSAYVDGELDAKQTELAERVLRDDAEAKRLLQDFRRTVELVGSLPRHPAPSGIAADLEAQVERAELLEDVAGPAAAGRSRRSPLYALLSMAATLALLTVGWWAIYVQDGPAAKRPVDQVALLDPTIEDRVAGAEGRAEKGADERGTGRGAAPAGPVGKRGMLQPEGNLIVEASLEEKLRSGIGADAIRAHTFESEPVRLVVNVRNETERNTVADRVATYLSGHRVADLAANGRGESLRTTSAGSFYVRGRPAANFSGEHERQLLVRARRSEVTGLMNELGQTVRRNESVTLDAGPISARGLAKAKVALDFLRGTTPAAGEAGAGAKQRDATLAAEDAEKGGDGEHGGSVDELLHTVGVPPDVVAMMSKPAPSEPSDSLRAGGTAAGPAADAKRPGTPETSGRGGAESGERVAVSDGMDRGPALRLSERVEAEEVGTDDSVVVDDSHRSFRGGKAADKGDDAVKKEAFAAREGETLREQPSLVQKRMKDLEKARGSRRRLAAVEDRDVHRTDRGSTGLDFAEEAASAQPPSTRSTTAALDSDPYVTLVIRVVVPEPRQTRETSRAKSAIKARQ